MDLVIVGAGPAGAWTACRLARAGARVTIVDPSHPREKPCGGGVTGRALSVVAGAIDGTLPRVVIRSARVRDPSARSAIVSLADHNRPGDVSLVVASRREFDAALLAAAVRAGAKHVAARVAELGRRGSRHVLTLSTGDRIEAGWLIGADGANSLVRRRLLAPFRRNQLSIATGFYAEGVTSDEIVLEIVGDPPGYLWSFPRPDHIAIGIGAQADAGATANALRSRAKRWIEDARLAPGARLVPYSWPIPTLDAGDFESLVVGGPDWLLVGDAAGLVDPITREGIFFALQSAEHAADALVGGANASAAYARRLGEEIIPELAKAATLKAGFFQPRFTALLLKALLESAGIRDVFADLVAGRQPYRTLRWRLLKTLEVGLAWKALARHPPGSAV